MADSGYCATCGQPLPVAAAYGAGKSTSKRVGIAISVLLHILCVVYYLTRDEPVRRAPPPSHEGAMVYIAPLAEPSKPKAPAAKPIPKPTQPKRTQVAKTAPPSRQKPAVAITPPARPKEERYVPPVVAPVPVPPAQDMEAMIAARRSQRAAEAPAAEPQESENERALRVARANIAGAQGKTSGNDREDSGGVFSINDKTFHSADIKFRGWNANFKRKWSQQVHVEQGGELDIETAIVKQMILLIRKEKPGDFVWESQRLGRNVPMSARKEDEAELQAFLLKEFFPEYRRGASR